MLYAFHVFSINAVMVIGPTPPGTGVIALTLFFTCSKSTSPTRRYPLGLDAFIEESNSLEAFISESDYKVHKEIIDHYFSDNSYQFMINNHDPKDWNKLWESNFDDIIIKDKLHIRALFHPKRNDIETELIISPKMAFGTGHHATTFQIMAWMVDEGRALMPRESSRSDKAKLRLRFWNQRSEG